MCKTLDQLCDGFGRPLASDTRRRIARYLKNPTFRRWCDIAGIVVRPGIFTLWQAVIAVDPTFPTVGRTVNDRGRVIKEWARIPDAVLIMRALRYAAGNDGG